VSEVDGECLNTGDDSGSFGDDRRDSGRSSSATHPADGCDRVNVAASRRFITPL